MDDYTTKPVRARTLEQLLRRWDLMSAEVRNSLREGVANKNTVANTVTMPISFRAMPVEEMQTAEASLRPPAVEGLQDLDPSLPRSPAVIELFLSSVPALLESLRVAMEREDTVNIKLLAHKLKGNCLSLGANKLAAVCHAIETAAVLGQVHHEACASMNALYAVVSSRLELRRSQTAASLRSGASNA
jgi:two-component system sensor histidine kinase/response regulator